VKKSLLQPSSHSREDNTNNDCTRALVSEYHYDVQRGRCPALDTGYTSHLDLKASIDKRGALAMEIQKESGELRICQGNKKRQIEAVMDNTWCEGCIHGR